MLFLHWDVMIRVYPHGHPSYNHLNDMIESHRNQVNTEVWLETWNRESGDKSSIRRHRQCQKRQWCRDDLKFVFSYIPGEGGNDFTHAIDHDMISNLSF